MSSVACPPVYTSFSSLKYNLRCEVIKCVRYFCSTQDILLLARFSAFTSLHFRGKYYTLFTTFVWQAYIHTYVMVFSMSMVAQWVRSHLTSRRTKGLTLWSLYVLFVSLLPPGSPVSSHSPNTCGLGVLGTLTCS